MNALNRTVVAPLSSAIIAVLLAGVVVVGVDRSGVSVQPGEARLEVNGVVEVAENGLAFARAEGTRILGHSDRVRVVEGTARLELPNASMAELRTGSAVAIADGDDAALVLEAGDLLVEAPRETVEVDGGTALVSVAGAAKLRRNASLVSGVYDGNVILQRDTNRFPVPRYRQAAAAGTGLLPDVAEPLTLSEADPWDLRMLPQVLDLDNYLSALGRNFESNLPAGVGATPELFGAMVPELATGITPALLEGRAPAENLIGLVLVALDDKGDFETRVERIFGFRSAGATWGLVAADRGLNPVPVIDQLESALAFAGAAGGEVAAGTSDPLASLIGGLRERGRSLGSTPAGEQVAAPPTPTTPAPGSDGTNPGGSEPGGTTPPGGTPPPPPATPPPPKRLDVPPTGTVLDPILEPVVDPLETLLSGVLDSLLGPVQTSTPVFPPPLTTATAPAPASTTTTTAPSTGLLGGLNNTIGGLLGG